MTAKKGFDAVEIQKKIQAILDDGSFEPFRAPDRDRMLAAIHDSSMDLVLFYVSLEREFGIQFSLEEIAADVFASQAELTALVQRKLAAR